MSSDPDLPLTLRHDQVSANAAQPCGPGNVYSHVNVAAGGRSHLGNSYNFGPTEDQQILQSILQSLHYPEMGQRGRGVSDAHAGTFEWLFEDCGGHASHSSEESHRDDAGSVADRGRSNKGMEPSRDEVSVRTIGEDRDERKDETEEERSGFRSTHPSHSYKRDRRNEMAMNLRRWLKDDGDREFWVTGKPGSGKSTFMKFLRDHDGADALLQEWARENHLIVADHFFWLPGTQLQNSFEGLARSLMYATLVSLTSDIASAKTICGKRRWSLTASHRPWSQSEFKRMFSNLGSLRGIRVFFLIDGLDECCPQHAHEDLMDTLMNMIRRPNFKTCLSSRPWKEFATKLRRSPSLHLDQVTKLDMITYVTNKIYSAVRKQPLMAEEVRKLVDLVVHRAGGVFLWVELVVRAVKIELKKDRGLMRVYSIVEDLPSELDEYFTTLIYDRIEKTSGNVSDTASVLSLAIQIKKQPEARHLPPFWIHAIQRLAFIDFWLLSRGALDSLMDCPNIDAPKFDEGQVDVMREQTRSFLELASKDLLVLKGGGVQFLHRTVSDFLINGSVNEAVRQRSPTHFQQPDFIPHVQMLRCVHLLMMADTTCGEVDAIMNIVARFPRADVATRKQINAITSACESLAIDHLQNTEHCLGKGGLSRRRRGKDHHVGIFPNIPTDLGVDPIPYRYVRTLFRYWPQIAHAQMMTSLNTPYRIEYKSISRMRLRHLCVLCTDIVHDCLYSGVVPNDWIAPRKSVSRKKFNPVNVSKPSVRSDDGPRCYRCEFCGVFLPSSKTNGLRDASLLFEKITFERLFPNANVLAQTHPVSPASEDQIIKVLPFEVPWSILRSVDGLHTLRATLRFQQFVWCRQNLRAARSLLTTMRRQFSNLAKARPDGHLWQHENPVNHMQAVWLDFLRSFITIPAWRRGDEYRCGGCNRYLVLYESVVVVLRCDDLLTYCESCYEQATQRMLGSSCVLTIQFQPEVFVRMGEEPQSTKRNRGIVKSVSKLIAWYSDTAPAFGLGYLIPSDTAEIQRRLQLIPESEV
jgi:hypothetical protein